MHVLVSVRDITECQQVLACGVGMIDFKETESGALSMLDDVITLSLLHYIREFKKQTPAVNVIVSATVGDSCDSAMLLDERMTLRFDAGVNVIKLPTSMFRRADLLPVIQKYIQHKKEIIAVLEPEMLHHAHYVSHIMHLSALGVTGVMVDTLHKAQSILQLVSVRQLHNFVQIAHDIGLFVGVAGGLQLDDIVKISTLQPDYIGFRGGLCEDCQRKNALSPKKLQQLQAYLQ